MSERAAASVFMAEPPPVREPDWFNGQRSEPEVVDLYERLDAGGRRVDYWDGLRWRTSLAGTLCRSQELPWRYLTGKLC